MYHRSQRVKFMVARQRRDRVSFGRGVAVEPGGSKNYPEPEPRISVQFWVVKLEKNGSWFGS